MIGHSMPIVHTENKGEWTLYEQDRWANGFEGETFLGEQTAIPGHQVSLIQVCLNTQQGEVYCIRLF